MITKEIKDIIRPLIECVASLTTKQAAILELIAQNIPEPQKSQLLASVKENDKRAEELRHSAQALL